MMAVRRAVKYQSCSRATGGSGCELNVSGRTDRSAGCWISTPIESEVEPYWRSSQVMLTSTWTSVPPDWNGTDGPESPYRLRHRRTFPA